MGRMRDSLATEENTRLVISSFCVGLFFFFIIVKECLSLAGQGCRVLVPENFKYQRYHQLPLVQLCIVFGAYSSESRSCLIQSFGLTLNVSGCSSTASYCALQTQGIPFQQS